jgi:hypothetical protein
MVIVQDGDDTWIYDSDDGSTNKTGLTGIGGRATEVILSENRAESAASATVAGQFGCSASVFKNVYFDSPFAPYQSDVEITINGFYSAELDSVAGGSRVRLTGFVRNLDQNDEEEIKDKVSNTFDFWTNNENFSITIDTDVEIGSSYEIGVKARTKAEALTTASAHADVSTSDAIIQYTGRIRYDSIEINWQ